MCTKHYSVPTIMAGKNFDMSRQWFVYFRFTSPITGEKKQKKYSNDFNRIKDRFERIRQFKALRDAIETMLNEGWDPIEYPDFADRPNKPNNIVEDAGLGSYTIPKALDFVLSQKKLAKKSKYDYGTTVRYIETACRELNLTHMPVRKLERRHIKSIMETIKTLKGLSDKAYNKHLTYFKALLSEMVEWGVFDGYHPAFRMKNLPEEQTSKFITLTKNEREKINEHLAKTHRPFYRYCMMLYYTGIRPMEILRLQKKQINLESKTIYITPEEGKTKTKKERIVAITKPLYQLLEELKLDTIPNEFYLFGKNFIPGSSFMHRRYATDLWDELVKKGLGINKYLYSLKHLGADDLIVAGIDIETIKDHFGHSSRHMTKRYARLEMEISRRKILSAAPTF